MMVSVRLNRQTVEHVCAGKRLVRRNDASDFRPALRPLSRWLLIRRSSTLEILIYA